MSEIPLPILTDDTVIVPKPTRKIVKTVRRETSNPKSSLYEVSQGEDRYYVVADTEEKVFEVAAMRILLRELQCSWPPLVSEVVR